MNDVAAGAHAVSKRFGVTTALDGVEFAVGAGEIHALVGENGAGKSTLVRILGGAVRPDQGRVTIGGRSAAWQARTTPSPAGVVTIPQELHLVPALSVAENLALGDPPVRRLFGGWAVIDRARMREEARAQLGAFDFAPDPDRPVRELGFAEQQIVAIAKALRRRCRVLILDEPTAALENREIARLFAVLAPPEGCRAPASSMSRIAWKRSWRSPTAAQFCATAASPRSCAAAHSTLPISWPP